MRTRFLVALLPLLACEGVAEPSIRRPSWIAYPARTIQAPDTVRAGVPFSATVTAAISGGGDCTRPDGTTVSAGDRVARVEMFVRTNQKLMCSGDVSRFHPIPITVVFPSLGISSIRVIGTAQEGSFVLDSVERTVVVVP